MTSILFINQPAVKRYFDLVKAQEGEFKRNPKYVSSEDLMAKAVGQENWKQFLISFAEAKFPTFSEQELVQQK